MMLWHSGQPLFEPGVMASILLIPSMVPPEDPFGFKTMLEIYICCNRNSHLCFWPHRAAFFNEPSLAMQDTGCFILCQNGEVKCHKHNMNSLSCPCNLHCFLKMDLTLSPVNQRWQFLKDATGRGAGYLACLQQSSVRSDCRFFSHFKNIILAAWMCESH